MTRTFLALIIMAVLTACASIPGPTPVFIPPVTLPSGVECTPNGCVGPPPAYPEFLKIE